MPNSLTCNCQKSSSSSVVRSSRNRTFGRCAGRVEERQLGVVRASCEDGRQLEQFIKCVAATVSPTALVLLPASSATRSKSSRTIASCANDYVGWASSSAKNLPIDSLTLTGSGTECCVGGGAFAVARPVRAASRRPSSGHELLQQHAKYSRPSRSRRDRWRRLREFDVIR